MEEQSPQPPSSPVPPAAHPRSERGPLLLLASQGQRLSSPGVVGNVTQRQAQTTQRPQSATGHKWSGASAAHRLLLLEAPALPGHTGSRASELRQRRAGVPSQAKPPLMASSPLPLPGSVPTRPQVQRRPQPATVPPAGLWPELSSGGPGGNCPPRPAEVKARNFLGIPRE